MKRKTKAVGGLIGVVLHPLLLIWFLYATRFSYLYCRMRENAWLSARNEHQLESKLVAFHVRTEDFPLSSSWARSHNLKEGQRVVRYLIFGKEPLDVVYFAGGTIDAIYTTYE